MNKVKKIFKKIFIYNNIMSDKDYIIDINLLEKYYCNNLKINKDIKLINLSPIYININYNINYIKSFILSPAKLDIPINELI